MEASKFTYTNNWLNLFYGLFFLVISLVFILGIKVSGFYALDFYLLVNIFYICCFCFCIWASFTFINSYRKLFGIKRNIIITDKAIVFPEFADSLNIIELNFFQIKKIYFSKNRHGHPDNLIIKYDLKGHAYIGKSQLSSHDFDEICQLFKLRLGLNEIGFENA